MLRRFFLPPLALFLSYSNLDSGKKCQFETLNIHYIPATPKTGFLGTEKEKDGYLDTVVEYALIRTGFGFPMEPQMTVPLLKT